jgi:hypothetical protein
MKVSSVKLYSAMQNAHFSRYLNDLLIQIHLDLKSRVIGATGDNCSSKVDLLQTSQVPVIWPPAIFCYCIRRVSNAVLSPGCAMLYYMIDAGLFFHPQLIPHREHS